MIGRWHGLVVDCPDPARLASFYEGLLGSPWARAAWTAAATRSASSPTPSATRSA